MSNFIVLEGQRFSVDETFKGSKHNVEDVTIAAIRATREQAQQDDEARRQYLEYCQSMHEKHIDELHQDEERGQDRRRETSKRQRYGDDYEGEFDYANNEEDDASFMKKCRNAAAEIGGNGEKSDATILPPSEFGQDAEWYVERESTAEKEKDYLHVMDPEQRDFESLMTEEDTLEPLKCFACDYMINPLANQMYTDQWVKVVRFFEKGIEVNMCFSSLGKNLHRVFMETVAKTMLREGKLKEDELMWTPYGILYHFLVHNKDPELQAKLNERKANRIIHNILTYEVFMKHPASKRPLTSKEAIAKCKQVAELRLLLAKPTGLSSSSSSSSSGRSASAAEMHSAAKKQMYLSSTKELVNRPNYMAPHSRHT